MLRAVLLADLVDSTAFVAGFGDERAARALQRLDLQIRDLLEFTGGRLIDKADGLLALFERPIQAVDFALRYQQAMRQFSQDEGVQLSARVGIHVGELMTWSNTDQAVLAGAKPLEVEGLAKPMAARLMGLALPGQVLVSSMAQALAQRAQAELGERAERVRWLPHGRYRFKGMPAPLLVHEVGEDGLAPLRQSPSGAKAWRDVPFWRRPPVLFAEGLVLLALATVFAFGLLRSPPAIAFQERDWIVIGDLSNFTGDQRLDDSLETALRISLEQSRYANVMPQVKVQSVLARMGRSPRTTIDRAVGSEIALREGARVLLLPSVTEVGGRLRFSLEVVDPSTQETVYADSAEGRGIESALGSVDAVSDRLRDKLGEASARIKADGRPLAQITTPNLEALRLYTLANEASIRDLRLGEAVRLQNLAIALDPDFAMAYSARARQHLANSEMAKARADFEMANRHRDRLSTREAMALDTGLAEFGPVQPRLQAWQAVARAFPDQYRAYWKIAEIRYLYQQRYQQGLDDLAPALTPKNQRFPSALNLAGILYLGLERYAESRAAFERAESIGTHDPVRYHADTEAVLRNYAVAERLVASQEPTGGVGFDMDNRLPEITYPVDRGRLEEGIAAARALAEARVDAQVQKRIYRGTWLGLRSVVEGKSVLPELRAVVAEELVRAGNPQDPDVLSSTLTSLYLGAVATGLGDARTGESVLDAVGAHAPGLGYPAVDDMLAVLRAELAMQRRQPKAAVEGLRARLDGGELNMVHAALVRAYEQAGRPADARREAEWLGTRRGRAFVEYNNQSQLQPLNVLQSNLAWLQAAELACRADDEAGARASLARFRVAWPSPPALVAGRLSKLQRCLTQRTGRTDRTRSPAPR